MKKKMSRRLVLKKPVLDDIFFFSFLTVYGEIKLKTIIVNFTAGVPLK